WNSQEEFRITRIICQHFYVPTEDCVRIFYTTAMFDYDALNRNNRNHRLDHWNNGLIVLAVRHEYSCICLVAPKHILDFDTDLFIWLDPTIKLACDKGYL